MLEGLSPVVTERLCLVGSKAAELDASDIAILNDALDDTRWSNTALSLALHERGFTVSRTLIGEHRAKKCRCFRI
jgi:hypothetical protein